MFITQKNFFLFEFLIEILLKEIQLKISTMKILKKERVNKLLLLN